MFETFNPYWAQNEIASLNKTCGKIPSAADQPYSMASASCWASVFSRCLHFWGVDARSTGQANTILLAALQLPPSEEVALVAREEWSCQRNWKQEQLDPPTLYPSLPSPTVFLCWERWQTFLDNWKLESAESNYPEEDFSKYTTVWSRLVSSPCPCFRNIPYVLAHIQPLLPSFSLAWELKSGIQGQKTDWSRPKPFLVALLSSNSDAAVSNVNRWGVWWLPSTETESCPVLLSLKWWEPPQTSDTYSSLAKMCPPALMGCWLLIWLHKKKIWAFILFRKAALWIRKRFQNGPEETGIQRLFYFLKYVVKPGPLLCCVPVIFPVHFYDVWLSKAPLKAKGSFTIYDIVCCLLGDCWGLEKSVMRPPSVLHVSLLPVYVWCLTNSHKMAMFMCFPKTSHMTILKP